MVFRTFILCVFMDTAGERDFLETRRASVGIVHRQLVWLRHIYHLDLYRQSSMNHYQKKW